LPSSCAPLHRNIGVKRMRAPHRKAHGWAAFHIGGSRASSVPAGK
jgi:hypothetical protein